MEHVFTSVWLYTGHVAQAATKADGAVLILLDIFRELFVNQDTIFVKTGQAILLSADSSADMAAALQHLVTTLLHQSLALSFFADISECWSLFIVFHLHNAKTETALNCFFKNFELLTRLTNVVRNRLTAATEVLDALWTVSSILAHMNRWFLWDLFTFVFVV